MGIVSMDGDRAKVCPTCHREFATTARSRKKYCDLCRKADPHRHRARQLPIMFAACDIESRRDGDRQKALTLSYGREDGTSGTYTFGDGPEAVWAGLRWLVDQLTGVHVDTDGKVWRQAPIGFHLNHDAAVYGVAFDETNMMLIHKSVQRHGEITPLCDTDGCNCERLHRRDTATITDVITDGGESGVIAWHEPSKLALAFTPGRRIYVEDRPHGDRMEQRRVLDIHDIGRSFTGSLEQVIDSWAPELTPGERRIITRGKAARAGGFAGWTVEDTGRYSEAECVALTRCARLLIDMVRSEAHVNIKPTSLFGAGSLANATLKYYGAPKREDSDLTDELYAFMDYYGGMIETPVIGLVTGTIQEKDINSAYPDKLRNVPCTKTGCGKWRQSTRIPKDAILGHVMVKWDISDTTTSTGPFTVRDEDGNVYQTQKGLAYASLVEYRAALARFGPERIELLRAWHWAPKCLCDNPMPFWFLVDLYDRRQTLKAQMKDHPKGSPEWQALNVRQEALKLVLNSMYGKMAQQRPDFGRYTNLHIAAYITGATRAQVRQETWDREDHGGHVIYQHTDSVKSIGGNPTDGGKALGAWGMEPDVENFVIIQPGFAVTVDPGGKGSTRGVRKGDVYNALPDWLETTDLTAHPRTWPHLLVRTNRMISRRQAIARGKPWTAGTFEESEMKIALFSNKRNTDAAHPINGIPTAWTLPPKPEIHNQATIEQRIRLQEYWHEHWQAANDQ